MSPSTNFTAAERVGMFKLTLPSVKYVLFGYWKLITLLIAISVLLGFVPTIKSEIESGLIDEISRTIRDRTTNRSDGVGATQKPATVTQAIREALELPISRFDRQQPAEGISEKLARALFGNVGIGYALLFYMALSIFAYAVDFLTTFFRTKVSREVFSALRGAGLTKGLVADPSRVPGTSNVPGQYSNAIQVGAVNVGNTYGYLLDAGQQFFSLGTALVLVFTKSAIFAVACLLIILIQMSLSYVQGRRLRRQRNELDTRRNDLLARTDDVLSKREIILAYERQTHYQQKLGKLTGDYADVSRALEIKEKVFSLSSQLVSDYGRMFILFIGLLVTVAVTWSSDGSQVAGIGDAYFFVSIYFRILNPANDLLRRYDSLKESEGTSRTFLAVLSPQFAETATDKSEAPADAVPTEVIENAATFQDVYFSYDPVPVADSMIKAGKNPWVLNGISFRIPLGKTTLVLGRSGCGKTTIARILLGFWRPNKGETTVLGRPIHHYTGDQLRGLMAYVSQGDHIIDDTVRENLSWGHTRDGKEISDARMLETLEQLKVIRTQEERDGVLDRLARDLSGGQQQRLSFARMMLDESAVVILDEPFTGVDIFTIRDIRKHLSQIFNSSDRTILMFSHRLAFAAFADHVVVFGKDGNIIEEGSPSELFARNGEFANLHNEARNELEFR